MFKIPKKVSDRLLKQVPKYQRVVKNAKNRDVNEADTVTIIADILADVFGYDKYTEITSEQCIRGTYCDLAVKTNGKVKFLLEAKAIGLSLKENHLRQAVGYCASSGIPWAILSNGEEWQIHRIKFEQPVATEHVCTWNFTELNARSHEDQNKLFLLCSEGLSKAAIEEFHDRLQRINRFSVAAVVLSDAVLNIVRRELRKTAPGLKVDVSEIKEILLSEVLKRDVVEGDAADLALNRIKKVRTKQARKKRQDENAKAGDAQSGSLQAEKGDA